MQAGRSRLTLGYGLAVGGVGLVFAARLALDPVLAERQPFSLFFLPVILAAWFGGTAPGVVAFVLGGLVADYAFVTPRGSLAITAPEAFVALTIYILVGLMIVFVIEAMRRSERALEESRARFQGVIASASDAIITVDGRQNVILFNRGAETIFGYTATEMIGQPLDRLIPERLRAIHRGHVDSFGLTGVSTRAMGVERVLTGVRRTGEEFPIEAYISKVTVGDDALLTVIVRDITERKRLESVLRAKEAELETILNRTPFMLTRCSRDLRYLFVSRAYAEMIGRRPEDVAGRPIVEIMGQDGFATIRPHIETVLRGTPVEYESDVPFKGVGPRSLHVQYTPERDARGDVTGWVASITDVSVRQRAEAERDALLGVAERARVAAEVAATAERDAREAAEAANRAKDTFLATVSHELRTPLSPILAWSRMLRQGVLDEDKTSGAVEAIERSAKLQAQLIEDLIDVSRIVTGRMRLEVRPIDLVPVIQAALDVVRPAAEAKGVRLQVVLDSEIGMISGDAERLQQVVWNLLSNAVKFTPKGGSVQVVLERVNSHAEIAVIDSGKGISAEFLPRVFERFEQAEQGSKRAHGGLGLGLAIVRHIIDLHGGTVHAESPGQGKGAAFTVKLPTIQIQRTAGEATRRHPSVGNSPDASPYPSLKGVRALVVDDDPDSNETVRVLLGSCGADVRVAGSAEQAREILGRWKPDVLVSDIGMPDEDGYGLISSVRALDGELPAVALTAYATVEDRVRLLTAGYHAHVTKPLDPAELVAVVASVARSAGKL
jgi:PAS domain S-box-containing protein